MKKSNSKTIEGNIRQVGLGILFMIIIGIVSSGMRMEDKLMEEDQSIELGDYPITDSDMQRLDDYYMAKGLEPQYDYFPTDLIEYEQTR